MHQSYAHGRTHTHVQAYTHLRRCSWSRPLSVLLTQLIPIRDHILRFTFLLQVYAVGSSFERLGKQVAFNLCYWIVVKGRNLGMTTRKRKGRRSVNSFLLFVFSSVYLRQ